MSAISKIRQQYYALEFSIKNKDQAVKEIGETCNIKKNKVYELIRDAKKSDFYEILLKPPLIVQKEKNLRDEYGLKDVCIAEIENRRTDPKKSIAEAADWYINRLLNKVETISISGGTTVSKWVDIFKPEKNYQIKNPIKICPLRSDLWIEEDKKEDPLFRTSKLTAQLYENFLDNGVSARLLDLNVGIIKNAADKAIILKKPPIAETLNEIRNSTLIVMGIGSLKNIDSTYRNILKYSGFSNLAINALKNSGIIGDIICEGFTKDGSIKKTKLNNLIVSLNVNVIKKLARIQRKKYVVGLAGGEDKIESIIAVIKGGFINTLITDDKTAERLLIKSK